MALQTIVLATDASAIGATLPATRVPAISRVHAVRKPTVRERDADDHQRDDRAERDKNAWSLYGPLLAWSAASNWRTASPAAAASTSNAAWRSRCSPHPARS